MFIRKEPIGLGGPSLKRPQNLAVRFPARALTLTDSFKTLQAISLAS